MTLTTEEIELCKELQVMKQEAIRMKCFQVVELLDLELGTLTYLEEDKGVIYGN